MSNFLKEGLKRLYRSSTVREVGKLLLVRVAERTVEEFVRGLEHTKQVAKIAECPAHVPPLNQARNIRKWAEKFGWPIKSEDFEKLPEQKWIPMSSDRAVVLVANPYPKEPWRTCDDLWQIICSQHERNEVARDTNGRKEIVFEKKRVVIPKANKKPILYWEGVDLVANKGIHPSDVELEHQTLSGLGLLFLAAHSPSWVKRLGEDEYPFPWIGGIEVNPGIFNNHRFYLQYICKGTPQEAVALGNSEADWKISPKNWSVPVVVM